VNGPSELGRIERYVATPRQECREAIQRAPVFIDDTIEFGFAFCADQMYSSRHGFHEGVCDAMPVQTSLSQVGLAVMFAPAVIGLESDGYRQE